MRCSSSSCSRAAAALRGALASVVLVAAVACSAACADPREFAAKRDGSFLRAADEPAAGASAPRALTADDVLRPTAQIWLGELTQVGVGGATAFLIFLGSNCMDNDCEHLWPSSALVDTLVSAAVVTGIGNSRTERRAPYGAVLLGGAATAAAVGLAGAGSDDDDTRAGYWIAGAIAAPVAETIVFHALRRARSSAAADRPRLASGPPRFVP